MKTVTLPLVSGEKATFYLGGNFVVTTNNTDPATCILVDGVHNNGGWRIAAPYELVVKEINYAEDTK